MALTNFESAIRSSGSGFDLYDNPEMSHFLYRHIRKDTGEVFYVGIGTKRKKKSYKAIRNRAFDKRNRNELWHRIVNKGGYEVEILLESDDYEFIKDKEIEFIELYGRRINGTGCLANFTDGGDGMLGFTQSES